jgi:serine/threonine-protein kinase
VDDPTLTSLISPGEIVAGKYRVERALGVGGMGVVVAARHVALDRVVAIKLLGSGSAAFARSREELVARFLTEARAAARIDSDHVCRVFDVGTTDRGVPFMVMEHLEGNDLEDEIHRRGQLSLVEAVDYVLQAAEALVAAHHLGIVHRDIKPSNLFLHMRPDGSRRVKVLDFGISKSLAAPSRNTLEPGSVGTPAYMAPEQVRGDADVDGRVDIWALGAILYELLTGQMAFVGKDINAILDHVLHHDAYPITGLRRDVPPEVESVIRRCLERDPGLRWPSAAMFALALAPFGSVGIVAQLASVQREVGSFASIRMPAAQSVEPVVTNVPRPMIETQPDPGEMMTRIQVIEGYSNELARKRTFARVIAATVGIVSVALATIGVLLIMHVRARQAAALSARPPLVATAAPTPVPVASDSAAAADTAPPVGTVIGASEPVATATATAMAAAPSVYPTSNPVQSAHVASAHPTARPATTPGHAAPGPQPKASGKGLLDTRD